MLGFEFETYQDLVKQNNAMNLIWKLQRFCYNNVRICIWDLLGFY